MDNSMSDMLAWKDMELIVVLELYDVSLGLDSMSYAYLKKPVIEDLFGLRDLRAAGDLCECECLK